MENPIDDTELEVEAQVEETTEADTTEETVENFSDRLDDAETEEDAIAAYNEETAVEPTVEEPTATDTEENVEATDETLDTEAAPSQFKFDLKDGDIEVTITDEKQAKMLMQQGLNYAGKTTELAKHRSFVQYAEENGITLEDIQMMTDIKAGKKEAIAKMAKDNNVDVFDLDNDMADDYKADPIQLPQQVDPMLDNIANEILGNDDYRESFQKWFPTMPQEIQQAVTSNPQVLAGVKEDIEAGVFDGAMDQAYKYQRINGMDFGSAYTRAKQEYLAIHQSEPTPEVTRGEKRRASAPRTGGGSGASTNRGGYAPGVISDMSDDEFLKNYHDIIRQVQGTR